MDIIVCTKWTPDSSEADLTIASGGKDIKKDDLDYDLNDWDRFAVEEGVRIKEKHGGKVIVVSVAPEESEDMLRESLARGADEAYQLWDDSFDGSDGFGIASILTSFIKSKSFDVVLTGTLADDDCAGQLGGMLAAMLDVPYAGLVSELEFNNGSVRFHKELEGGLYGSEEIDLPAVLAVATGLNEPRFVSIRAVRKVANIEIPSLSAEETGVASEKVGVEGARTEILKMELPPEGEGAEILKGKPEEAAEKLAAILKEKGGII